MRALTLYRPWAWSIVHGPKRIENRPWKPWPSVIGQRIALHAGKRYDKKGEAFIMEQLAAVGGLPVDAEDEGIVGVATVRGFVSNPAEIQDVDQVEWFFGPFGWVLEDVRAVEPIPCSGALGLWQLPAAVEAEVRRVLR